MAKNLPITGDIRDQKFPTPVLYHETHAHGHYFVEHHGAGVHGVFFIAKRARKPQYIATASSIDGAKVRIAGHVAGKYGSHKAT